MLQVVGCMLWFSWLFFHSFRKDGISGTTPYASTFKRTNCLLLGCHESVITRVYSLLRVWNELDIRLFCATDMSNRILSQLNASLAVLLDYIASHVRIALAALDDNTVVTTGIDSILPNLGCAQLRPIRTSDFNAILMTSVNLVLDQMSLIIVDFDSNFIQIKGVSNNQRLDIKIGVNGSTSTEIDPILGDARPALLALDIDSIRVA